MDPFVVGVVRPGALALILKGVFDCGEDGKRSARALVSESHLLFKPNENGESETRSNERFRFESPKLKGDVSSLSNDFFRRLKSNESSSEYRFAYPPKSNGDVSNLSKDLLLATNTSFALYVGLAVATNETIIDRATCKKQNENKTDIPFICGGNKTTVLLWPLM